MIIRRKGVKSLVIGGSSLVMIRRKGVTIPLSSLLLQGATVEELDAINLQAVFLPCGLGHFIGVDTHDVGGYLRGPSFAYSRPAHSFHTRRDRVAPLPTCRLHGAATQRDSPLSAIPSLCTHFTPPSFHHFEKVSWINRDFAMARPKRVLASAACTLNATGPSHVTLSLR